MTPSTCILLMTSSVAFILLRLPRISSPPASDRRGLGSELQLSVLQKAEISAAVDNDVIEKLYADAFSGGLELAGYVCVAKRWFQASGRMVVRHNDAGGAVGHGIGEDFARMNRTAVNETDGNHAHVQHFVGAIDGGAKEMLLFAVRVMP